jgi:succinoglycan biosynthesis protein ExoL
MVASMTPDRNDPRRTTLLFFAHNADEARFLKRLLSFRDLGFSVSWVGYDRGRGSQTSDKLLGQFPHTQLGRTIDENYIQRVWVCFTTLGRLILKPGLLRAPELLYCTNVENLAVMMLARYLRGLRGKVIYEVADIQPAMVGSGVVGRLLRFVERLCLRHIDLLVVTSPAYLDEFLTKRQLYDGPSFLLENKVYFGPETPKYKPLPDRIPEGPLTVGLFGNIKCERSLKLIELVARAVREEVSFILRGYPLEDLKSALEQLVSDNPNIKFLGPYSSPDDLPGIYSEVDLCWGFDFRAAGGNSKWCLANRIYEAGLFGVPLLVEAETMGGKYVERLRSGWSLREPLDETLIDFFRKISPAEVRERQKWIRGLPVTTFLLNQDLLRLKHILQDLAA